MERGFIGFLTVTLIEALQMVVIFIPAEFIQLTSGMSYPWWLAMILCDINSLKTVNDTLGHDAGDQYIRNCASLICRASEGVPVYRVGGDEFLLILADEDQAKAPAVMRNLCDLLARAGSEKTIESGLCSFAYGLGEYNPETDQTLSDIFRRADETMYKHKVKAWIQR